MPYICSHFYSSVFDRCCQHSFCFTGHGVSQPQQIQDSIFFLGATFTIHTLITKSQKQWLVLSYNICALIALILFFILYFDIARNISRLLWAFTTFVFIQRKLLGIFVTYDASSSNAPNYTDEPIRTNAWNPLLPVPFLRQTGKHLLLWLLGGHISYNKT
jgi:hypothetical protein